MSCVILLFDFAVAEPRLVFIRQTSLVGNLRGCDVFKISSVVTVPLESDVELLLEPCAKNHHKIQVVKDCTPLACRLPTGNPHITQSDVVTPKNLLKVKPTAAAPRGSEHHVTPPKKSEK